MKSNQANPGYRQNVPLLRIRSHDGLTLAGRSIATCARKEMRWPLQNSSACTQQRRPLLRASLQYGAPKRTGNLPDLQHPRTP